MLAPAECTRPCNNRGECSARRRSRSLFPELPTLNQLANRQRMLAIGLVAALGMYLFLQPGAPLDEPEHLHVAWLMVHLGLRPIHDFFEHHTPLLWHVLGLAYRAGVSGPEVLYFGRALTLACAALWVSALFALVRRWSGGRRGGLFAFASFALTAVFAPDLLVARPETLAMALLALALLCLTAPSRTLSL